MAKQHPSAPAGFRKHPVRRFAGIANLDAPEASRDYLKEFPKAFGSVSLEFPEPSGEILPTATAPRGRAAPQTPTALPPHCRSIAQGVRAAAGFPWGGAGVKNVFFRKEKLFPAAAKWVRGGGACDHQTPPKGRGSGSDEGARRAPDPVSF